MAKTNWNIPFSVQNSQRKYPLEDSATCIDTSGSFILPDDFIVGFHLPVHSGNSISESEFFVKTVGVYDSGFAVVIGYGSAASDVATAWISRSGHTRNKTYRMGGVGSFLDSIGTIVIGRFDEIDTQPAGSYDFTLASGKISTDVIRPIVQGVSSISVSNGSEVFGPFYGDIEFVAMENQRIVATAGSGNKTIIEFSAIEGEGLAEPCECEGDGDAPSIRRINGIPADENHNFFLLGSDCQNLDPSRHGLKLIDLCSQPCCGSKELEEITSALKAFKSRAITLEKMLNSVDVRTIEMDSTVLGSKFGDRSCSEVVE